ncbi:MAG: hypothetical protein GY835_16885 [bacterium]|nr:hypothetical protein [bacterium]
MSIKLAQRYFEEAAQHYEQHDSEMSKLCSGLAQMAEAIRSLDERLQRIEGSRGTQAAKRASS